MRSVYNLTTGPISVPYGDSAFGAWTAITPSGGTPIACDGITLSFEYIGSVNFLFNVGYGSTPKVVGNNLITLNSSANYPILIPCPQGVPIQIQIAGYSSTASDMTVSGLYIPRGTFSSDRLGSYLTSGINVSLSNAYFLNTPSTGWNQMTSSPLTTPLKSAYVFDNAAAAFTAEIGCGPSTTAITTLLSNIQGGGASYHGDASRWEILPLFAPSGQNLFLNMNTSVGATLIYLI